MAEVKEPGRPAPHADDPPRHGWLTWMAIGAGALALMLIGADLGPRAFLLGAVLAVVPVPVYVALALWVDRFEPEASSA